MVPRSGQIGFTFGKSRLPLAALAVDHFSRRIENSAELSERTLALFPAGRAERQAVVKQAMARAENFGMEFVEVHDEALVVELLGLQGHLKLPSVAVQGDTWAKVPADVVGKVDENAISNAVQCWIPQERWCTGNGISRSGLRGLAGVSSAAARLRPSS